MLMQSAAGSDEIVSNRKTFFGETFCLLEKHYFAVNNLNFVL